MFQEKRARVDGEKERLCSIRVQPDSPVAVEVAEVSGQNVTKVRFLCVCWFELYFVVAQHLPSSGEWLDVMAAFL
jgi:hypothetical protein